MSSLQVLLFFSYYLVSVFAGNDVKTNEELLIETKKNITIENELWNSKEEKFISQKQACQDEIHNLTTINNSTNQEWNHDMSVFESLEKNRTDVDTALKTLNRQIENKTIKLEKLRLEVALMIGYSTLLNERTQFNKSAMCFTLMQLRLKLNTKAATLISDAIKLKLDRATNELQEAKEKNEDKDLEMRDHREICDKRIKDLKEAVEAAKEDDENVRRHIKLLQSSLNEKYLVLSDREEKIKELDVTEKVLVSQLKVNYSNLKKYEADETCYKNLEVEVLKQYNV